MYFISKLARENNIKVLLSGVGGDDLFCGYRRHHALYLEKYWNWAPAKITGTIKNITARLDARKSLYRRMSKLFSGAELYGNDRLVNYYRWTDQNRLNSIYSSEFITQLGNDEAASPMLEFLEPLTGGITDMDRMLALDQRFFLADHNLIYTDKMSMAASVEVRVPFLDVDLVNLASSIPISNLSQENWIRRPIETMGTT